MPPISIYPIIYVVYEDGRTDEIDFAEDRVVVYMEKGEIRYEYPEGGWDLTGYYDCKQSWVDSGVPQRSEYRHSGPAAWYFSDKTAADRKAKELLERSDNNG